MGRHQRCRVSRHRSLALATGLRHLGRQGRRPRGHPLREPAGVGHGRLRHPLRVPRSPFPSIRRCSAGRSSTSSTTPAPSPSSARPTSRSRSSPRSARHCPARPQHHRLRSAADAARRGADASRESSTSGRKDEEANGRARFDELAHLAQARRSGHARLHLGHDRQPERRHAHARQHHQQRRRRARRCCRSRPATIALSILPLSHILERTADYPTSTKAARSPTPRT